MKRKKKANLLIEEDITKYDVAKKFINRNLVDTSYACRSVMNTLQHYFQDNDIHTKVHTIRGQATNTFRKRIRNVLEKHLKTIEVNKILRSLGFPDNWQNLPKIPQ